LQVSLKNPITALTLSFNPSTVKSVISPWLFHGFLIDPVPTLTVKSVLVHPADIIGHNFCFHECKTDGRALLENIHRQALTDGAQNPPLFPSFDHLTTEPPCQKHINFPLVPHFLSFLPCLSHILHRLHYFPNPLPIQTRPFLLAITPSLFEFPIAIQPKVHFDDRPHSPA
jgi:hypothetical protein